MKVICYPADDSGCGSHRVIWPAQYLKDAGHDVTVVLPGQRAVHIELRGDQVVSVRMPDGVGVVVLQRITNRYMAQAIPLMRQQGIAVVVDIDDDLTCIHPANPAFAALHPRNEGHPGANGQISHHSWHHLTEACKAATLVTCSTEALLGRYAAHGRGQVILNYLADHYYGVPHQDSELVGWPASLMSHPDDPDVVGPALARLVNQHGAEFDVTSYPDGVGRAFGLTADPPGVYENVSVMEWPERVAKFGIGIAPLKDSKFNQSKSWLKPLEMSALGIPWVGSPRAEYSRLHDLGAGLLADNPKQWFKALKGLLESETQRKELAEAGREVADGLRLRDHTWRHAEAWAEAFRIQRG